MGGQKLYQKYLIVASKKDPAGINITTQLSQFRNPVIESMKEDAASFDYYLRDEEIISDENLNLEKIARYDFIIFASKHQSEKKEKTLSIHAPGNWSLIPPRFGGKEGKVCPTSALFQKQLFENLNRIAKEHNLKEYNITLECTHHGPLINKPCVFIEIGSTEEQWKDRKAGFIIAKAIKDTINKFKPNQYREIAVGIGGPHYCPNFNKIQLNSNVAISHIISSYALPLTEEMLRQAIEKTEEEIDFAILDWKGIPGAEERANIINILNKNYILWKKTSNIVKS